jgi:menaquinone-dependent protoporphyrinogen IX oxidase
MKNLLYYKSNTGFTEKYVNMLKNRIVPLDVYKINKISNKDLKDADNIFYGGPIRNNVILGLDKFLKKYKHIKDKNIFIFAVGIQPATDEKRHLVITANNLDSYHVRLYLLPGGLDIKKMPPLQRFLMKIGLKQAAKQEGGASSDLILSRLSVPMNNVDNANLDIMVNKFHDVNIGKK